MLFVEALEMLLQGHCTPQLVRDIESGGSIDALAAALEHSGFYALLAPEEAGGGAASWPEFHRVVELCGAYGLPVPLAQTMAARALVRAPEQLPAGLLTFAPWLVRGNDGKLRGNQVAFGRTASHVIGVAADAILLLPVQSAQQEVTLHGSLAASLCWDARAGTMLQWKCSPQRLQALAGVIHASLLSGAMKRVFDLAMGYANERVQFGKPIGKFQAIQHQLSVAAEHAAAATIATEAAFHALEEDLPKFAACAAAKARASEAAQLVASIAHAVHGAIGVTEEYDLQLYTRRLHEWRMAEGSESMWHRVLGEFWLRQGDRRLVVDLAREVFA